MSKEIKRKPDWKWIGIFTGTLLLSIGLITPGLFPYQLLFCFIGGGLIRVSVVGK